MISEERINDLLNTMYASLLDAEDEYPETIDALESLVMFVPEERPFLSCSPFELACRLHDTDGEKLIQKDVALFILEVYFDEYANGNPHAANNLGSLYYTGRAGEQSYKKAVEYYTYAADHGERQAQENLGYCYYYGRDVEKDYEKAYHYFVKGALDGHVISLYKIGDMYKNGYYVPKDEHEAFCIYNHCAELLTDDSVKYAGADIFMRLAQCYHKGIGTNIDYDLALHLYQRSEGLFYERLRHGDYMIAGNLDRVVAAEEEVRRIIRASMPDKK